MIMDEKTIFKKIKDIISQACESDATIELETNFENDLNADSLDIFEILNEIEDEFKIKLNTNEKIETVQDLVELVKDQFPDKEIKI